MATSMLPSLKGGLIISALCSHSTTGNASSTWTAQSTINGFSTHNLWHGGERQQFRNGFGRLCFLWVKYSVWTVVCSGHGIPFPPACVKAELLVLARACRQPPEYACVKIAVGWGHRVLFTPPYHPELQPIEIVWAVGKNWIGQAPATSMAELKDKIGVAFGEHVSARTWIGAFKKAQKFEDKYFAMLEEAALADDDASDDGGDSDDDLVDALLQGDREFLEVSLI